MSLQVIEQLVKTAFVIAAVMVSFLVGMLIMQKQKNEVLAERTQTINQYSTEVAQYTESIEDMESQIASLQANLEFYDTQTQDSSLKKQELLIEINELKSKIVDLNAEIERRKNSFPFQVPTKGVVATHYGFFDGVLYGMDHLGIDIWTTTQNGGQIANHKGNPVFSACNGQVLSFQEGNGGMTINCDPIPRNKGYKVPKYDVNTYYGHMGHALTKQLYFTVGIGERVRAGQLIGYQGDLSSFFPHMRNVHLHFSVYTGLSETDPNGGAINPCLYVGGECQTVGYKFEI